MTPQQVLDSHDQARLWSPDAGATTAPGLAQAYQTQLAVTALRLQRGERPLGYKIGFTNRTIWQRYGVFAPIWGPVWDTTVSHCDARGQIDLSGTCQPRLEPEVVFGLSATPAPDATLDDLFGCVEWLAPGFEIVQSHCADWKFHAAQTVLDGALHARLLVGARVPVRAIAASGQALDEVLARTGVRLFQGNALIDQGVGANVLDGPLHALHHFVRELQGCPGARALQPGDIVTTGTWTDAWPLAPGQRWRSEFDAPLAGLEVVFA